MRAGEQRVQAEDMLHARTGPPRSRNCWTETDRCPRRDGIMACRTASARYDPSVTQCPNRRFLHINNERGNSGQSDGSDLAEISGLVAGTSYFL